MKTLTITAILLAFATFNSELMAQAVPSGSTPKSISATMNSLGNVATIKQVSAGTRDNNLLHASTKFGIRFSSERDAVIYDPENLGARATLKIKANHIYHMRGTIVVVRQTTPFKIKYAYDSIPASFAVAESPSGPGDVSSLLIETPTFVSGSEYTTDIRSRGGKKPGAVFATVLINGFGEITIADEFDADPMKLGDSPVLVDGNVVVNFRGTESGGDHTTVWIQYVK
ncbi:hypothetical protein Poly51_59540 [Rubripirellula tenax]|uniref:Uncharacterized protein n=1 Tax=Rubripirellula tenax TaxID=2528015 RepID=A0A5C6E841_9BACT|nr:hypothetical protein [Rubripirellula tenax]TWU44685.1 hypothetical protein Poly51_59540 [Rubripirellula tenax]